MKKFLFLSALTIFSFSKASSQTLCENGMAGIYPCSHVDLQKFLSMEEIGGAQNTNDIWGWTSPFSGKEYALVGKSNGTAFVDMSDPVNPIYLGDLPSHTPGNNLWRGIKVYNDYAFVVSEAAGHGMQVMNLEQLDDVISPPVEFAEDNHYPEFGNCHTIAINEETGYAYCVGTATYNGGLHVIDISDPLNPIFAGGFEQDGYTHECQSIVYTGPDTDYAGAEITVAYNENTVTVVNTTDKTDMILISRTGYPDSEATYTHQGWFTKDQRYLLMNDELDELNLGTNTRTHMWDMLDLDIPVYLGFYLYDNPSIDHNLYIINNVSYNSNYNAGLRILDITDLADASINEVAYFDVIPSTNLPIFEGTWSNYPFFASSNIPLTSMYDGLFIVKPRLIFIEQSEPTIYCNQDTIAFDITSVLNLFGTVEASIAGLPAGVEYYLEGNSMNTPGTGKIVITNSNLITEPSLPILVSLFNSDTTVTIDVLLLNSESLPSVAQLQLPTNAFTLLSTQVLLQWNASGASNSRIEISFTSDFSTIENSFEVENTNTFLLDGLNSATTYFWRVINYNNCGEAAESNVFSFITGNVVSLNETKNGKEMVNIFPNPTAGKILIEGMVANQVVNVLDVTGKILKSINTTNQKYISIDLSSLDKGVYFLKFTKQNIVKKIVLN
jgi:choice-of-anchor B domain-containing protein